MARLHVPATLGVLLVIAQSALAQSLQEECGNRYACYLRACQAACGANRFCREACFRRWDACRHANGCDFTFPFCLTGEGVGCDPSSDSRMPAGCSMVRVINRTGEALADIEVNGRATGAIVPSRSSIKLFVPPSLSGVTVTAHATVSRDARGAPCAWSFTRAGCLDEQQRQRVVFRPGGSSCAAAVD